MNFSRICIIFGFIIIGILSRLLPHPPNFTSLNAIALFSALYFQNRWVSLCTLYFTLFFSDLILGFHTSMPYTYLSFGLIAFLGCLSNQYKGWKFLPVKSLCASILFFIVSDFGVWMTSGMYSKTLAGLSLCYLAAIPFLLNQIAGDLFYLTILVGYSYFIEKIVFKQRYAY